MDHTSRPANTQGRSAPAPAQKNDMAPLSRSKPQQQSRSQSKTKTRTSDRPAERPASRELGQPLAERVADKQADAKQSQHGLNMEQAVVTAGRAGERNI